MIINDSYIFFFMTTKFKYSEPQKSGVSVDSATPWYSNEINSQGIFKKFLFPSLKIEYISVFYY